MNKFMLLFRNTPISEEQYQSMSPEAMQAELDKWMSWIGGIAAQGKLVESEALQPTGKILTGSRKVLSDGPYAEGKEIASGYLILNCETLDEAVEHAQGCPIFEIEGSVEVRQVQVY